MDQKILEYNRRRGRVPDRYYYAMNGKTAEENFFDQLLQRKADREREKQQQEALEKYVQEIIEKELEKSLEKALSKVFK